MNNLLMAMTSPHNGLPVQHSEVGGIIVMIVGTIILIAGLFMVYKMVKQK